MTASKKERECIGSGYDNDKSYVSQLHKYHTATPKQEPEKADSPHCGSDGRHHNTEYEPAELHNRAMRSLSKA